MGESSRLLSAPFEQRSSLLGNINNNLVATNAAPAGLQNGYQLNGKQPTVP